MRADRFLYLCGKFPSRNKAAEYLEQGKVLINGRKVKPSFDMCETDNVELVGDGYVSNGGYKLETAVKLFNLSFAGKICVDVGASTGGFTDCMLRYGCEKIYAVDVGENQLSPAISSNPKVVVLDNTNARNLHASMFAEVPDAVTCDVSFISLTLVLPAIFSVMGGETVCVALIKPQFEAGKKGLNKNGIVRDPEIRQEVAERIYDFIRAAGFRVFGLVRAFKRDPDMNSEYLICFSRSEGEEFPRSGIAHALEEERNPQND